MAASEASVEAQPVTSREEEGVARVREVEGQGQNLALQTPSLSLFPSPPAAVPARALGRDPPSHTLPSLPRQAQCCPLSPALLLDSDPAAWAWGICGPHRPVEKPGERFLLKGKGGLLGQIRKYGLLTFFLIFKIQKVWKDIQ